MSRKPMFESWGLAVINNNYASFKKRPGERERSRYTLPCKRSLCSGCKTLCGGRNVYRCALHEVA